MVPRWNGRGLLERYPQYTRCLLDDAVIIVDGESSRHSSAELSPFFFRGR